MNAKTEGSISRRRIIQGAAWATPAILIATGSPPAAASGATALLQGSLGASTSFTLTPRITRSGGYLTDVVITITAPYHTNTTSHPTTAAATSLPQGWSFQRVLSAPATWTLTPPGSISTASALSFAIAFDVKTGNQAGFYGLMVSAKDQDGDTVTASL